MDKEFVVVMTILGVCLAAALASELMETIQKWIGLKQDMLKAPPPQPAAVPPQQEQPAIPQEVPHAAPALAPRRGGGDGQGHP